MSKKKENPGSFITHVECSDMMATQATEIKTYVKAQVDPVVKALIGSDPFKPEGLVKDVGDIKRKLDAAKTIADYIKPIAIAVTSAILTAIAFKILGM